MSVTRDANPKIGYNFWVKGGLVRITLDGNLLNNNYRARPVNFFRFNGVYDDNSPMDVDNMERAKISKKQSYIDSLTDEYSKNKNTNNYNYKTLQKQSRVENEDRIFSDKPIIPNALKYIRRIDILIAKGLGDVGSMLNTVYEKLGQIKNFIENHKNLFHFYDSIDDMAMDRNEITIDFNRLKSSEEEELSDDDYENIDYYISKIVLFMGLYSVLSNSEDDYTFKSEVLGEADSFLEQYGLLDLGQTMTEVADEGFGDELGKDELIRASEEAQNGIKELNARYPNVKRAQRALFMVTNFVHQMGGNTIYYDRGIMQKYLNKK